MLDVSTITDDRQMRAHRPADDSGKKRPTRKNALIADPARCLHYLGPAAYGATTITRC